MSEYNLVVKSLTKKYQNFLALNELSVYLKSGTIVGLLGPNGSGKTTLMKLIAGLLTPTSGEIMVCDQPIGVESKKIVSYLPDHNFLAPGMTIQEALDYYADFFEDFQMERALDMIHNLGLEETRLIKTLSKGNKEKVALILCMSRRAKLYLLDEPIAGVDPATRDYILQTIISNYEPDSTVVISTHLIADIENVLDDVIFLNKGEIRLHASVDSIREEEGKSVDEMFREVFRW